MLLKMKIDLTVIKKVPSFSVLRDLNILFEGSKILEDLVPPTITVPNGCPADVFQ